MAAKNPRFNNNIIYCNDHGVIDLQLGAETESSTFPNILPEPAERVTGLGDSVIDFCINVGILGEAAS